MNEVPLQGGRTTRNVVRVESTVRRPRAANSDLVHRLLKHFEAMNFHGVPRSLGTDERGRHAFTFIEGEVPAELDLHGDETLRQAALLIRRFHDLSAELIEAAPSSDAGIEVVCHNDLSPCNFVFRSDVPVAIIDFDAAAPGLRSWDVSYAAWLWLDLGSDDFDAEEQRRRLGLFIEAYGGLGIGDIVAAIQARQAALAAEGRRLKNDALATWSAECLAWTQQHSQVLNRS
jgi:serine/threonine protein kinase